MGNDRMTRETKREIGDEEKGISRKRKDASKRDGK